MTLQNSAPLLANSASPPFETEGCMEDDYYSPEALTGWAGVFKRSCDMAGAGMGLVIFAIPMAVIAMAIKFHDGGTILYRQRRFSRGGRTFIMLKFRTMIADAEKDGPVFARGNDSRCTRVGRWLRATCLDELPQFFNIMRGEMSLIGPRPERPEMFEQIQRDIPGFSQRLRVRAGLTGWAQINGYRGRTCFRKRLEHDLYYINHWTPLLDLRIFLATIAGGFHRRGKS